MSDDTGKPAESGKRSKRLTEAAEAAKLADEARERQVAELKETVDGLAETVERHDHALKRARSPELPAILWHDLTPEEYAEKIGELRGWLRGFLFPRFTTDAALLAFCWEAHPPVVEALTMAWQTAAEAWSEAGQPMMRAQWHGVWRVNLRAALEAELQSCRKNGHNQRNPDGTLRAAYDPVAADEVIDGVDPEDDQED
jgi:hypothetical protein